MPETGSFATVNVPPATRRDWLAWPARWVCPLIVAATLLAYLPALRNGFVWNDADYVTRAELRTTDGLARIWFEPGATEQYYPVLHSAFWLEHRLWGDSPLGYHLCNVLLHATAACCLGLILRRLAVPGAWLGALLFALHPVCVESVAWIAEQKNTLSTVFYLAAALAYLRFDENRHRRWYVLATGLFAAALLSKSVTATLPAALLVVFWWRRGALSWRRDVLPLLPWFVLGAAGGLFTAWVEKALIGAEGPEFILSPLQRGLVAGRVIWFYLGKLVWPAPLTFIYPRWTVDAAAAWQYVFPLAALGLLAGLWLFRQRGRGPLAAALLFVGTLFPVLGFLNVYAFIFSFVADHLQYLACPAILALLAAGLARLLAPAPRPLGLALGLGLLALLGARTWRQCVPYRDLATFYRAIIAGNPDCWLARYNLGNLLRESGRTADAIMEYEQALRAKPDYPEAEDNLGLALMESGRLDQAMAHYEAALRLKPDFAAVHSNLGIALRAAGKNAEAIAHYRQALRLKPDYAEACYNLGLALLASGRTTEAGARFAQAVRLRPDFPEALNSLGNSLQAAGNFHGAMARYEEALRGKPGYPDALNNLGNALRALGRNEEAISRYEQALQRQPQEAAVLNNLGTALASAGRMTEAVVRFEAAALLKPDSPDLHRNLGLALASVGRTDEAIAQFEQVLRLRPDDAAAHLQLAIALRKSGRPQEAARHDDEARRLGAALAPNP